MDEKMSETDREKSDGWNMHILDSKIIIFYDFFLNSLICV